MTATPLQVTTAVSVQRKHVVLIYSDEYLEALENLPVHSKRERMTFALLRALQLLPQLQLIAPTPATSTALEMFHHKAYVEALRTATAKTNQSQLEEFELVDDAHVFPGLFQYCTFVAGATLTAVDALLHLMATHDSAGDAAKNSPTTASQQQQTTNKARAPVAINLGGGRHHAMRSNASGFCYVNDVVLGIQRLLTASKTKVKGKVEHVLCLDIDVHHGDGIQEAFYYSGNVTTVSFHHYSRGFFPNTGTQKEIGGGQGKFHSINVPLDRGIGDERYVDVFTRVTCAAVAQLKPDVIVLVCGVDTLARSRDPLGCFNLTNRGIGACIEVVSAFNLPMLLLGGGGYSGPDACKAFVTVVETALIGKAADKASKEGCIPDHTYYPEYGPDFSLDSKAASHRPDTNTTTSIEHVVSQALDTIASAAAVKDAATDKKRKRAGSLDDAPTR